MLVCFVVHPRSTSSERNINTLVPAIVTVTSLLQVIIICVSVTTMHHIMFRTRIMRLWHIVVYDSRARICTVTASLFITRRIKYELIMCFKIINSEMLSMSLLYVV